MVSKDEGALLTLSIADTRAPTSQPCSMGKT